MRTARESFRGSWAPAKCFLLIHDTVEADAKTVFFMDREKFLPHPLKFFKNRRCIRGLFGLFFPPKTKNSRLFYSSMGYKGSVRVALSIAALQIYNANKDCNQNEIIVTKNICKIAILNVFIEKKAIKFTCV